MTGTVALVAILSAQAATPLAVSCAGVVSTNTITWSAAPTGGATPYTFLWSGDSKVAGSTSTSILATYDENGTYTADIQVIDASSSVATSTCSAMVTSFPAPTSTLTVVVGVSGGSAIPANFSVGVTGGNPQPSSFAGSAGTAVTLNSSSSYSVAETSIPANYSPSYGANCSSSGLAPGTSAVCTITNTYTLSPVTTSTVNVTVAVNGGSAVPGNFMVAVTGGSPNPASFLGSAGTAVVLNANSSYSVTETSLPANYGVTYSGGCASSVGLSPGSSADCTITDTFNAATTTPPLPRVNPPSLSIGPNGSFLGRGMTVTSVGTNTFQAQVWGITYTVNWSGNLPTFYLRGGNTATSTPSEQLQVGDEVGVMGKVDPSAPLVVNANIVRDYSIIRPRPPRSERGSNGGNGVGYGNNGNGIGWGWENGATPNAGASVNATVTPPTIPAIPTIPGNPGDFQGRMNNLMQQFNRLSQMFKNRFGNGKGH